MKKTILTLIISFISVLLFAQNPPKNSSSDTVKVAVVFKNVASANKYVDSLQMASQMVLSSAMPSKEAQQVIYLIGTLIDYMTKNNIVINSLTIQKEVPKKNSPELPKKKE